MNTIQHVHRFIEHIYQASSLNIAIQDGPEAGQSVPHLHTHVIPRHRENNIGDEMYEKLADFDAAQDFVKRREAVLKQQKEGKIVVKPDDARFDRDVQVMEDEAQWLAEELAKFYSK
jgi:bis(5'-adenosyl)-triphosphatase